MSTVNELDTIVIRRTTAANLLRTIKLADQWRLLVLALALFDAFAVTSAFSAAYLIRLRWGLPFLETPPHSSDFYSALSLATVPAWLVIAAVYGLYRRQYLLGGFLEYTKVFNTCTMGMVAVVIASFFEPSLFISRGWLVLAWLLSIILMGSFRFGFRRIAYRLRQKGFLTDATIIVGANEEARALAEHLRSATTAGMRIVGAVDDLVLAGTPLTDGICVLGGLHQLENLMRTHEAHELLVAPTALSREALLELYRNYNTQRDVHIRMSSGIFEILTTGVSIKQVGGLHLISPEKLRITGIDAAMKTALDLVGAALGLALASPLFVIIALIVKLDSPGPIFHRRRVLGREGQPFDALKFRTMVANADEVLNSNGALRQQFEQGFKLKDDPRVTRVGKWLRRTSLDELPQLINVLLGQMSIVGPRMIAPEEAERYGKWQLNLLTVKPGITGPWQVSGRNELTYAQRVELSMQYIRNHTIWLDLQIIFQTIPVVFGRKGAY